jgi:hypothetical protein
MIANVCQQESETTQAATRLSVAFRVMMVFNHAICIVADRADSLQYDCQVCRVDGMSSADFSPLGNQVENSLVLGRRLMTPVDQERCKQRGGRRISLIQAVLIYLVGQGFSKLQRVSRRVNLLPHRVYEVQTICRRATYRLGRGDKAWPDRDEGRSKRGRSARVNNDAALGIIRKQDRIKIN